jgi:hypothetical protein
MQLTKYIFLYSVKQQHGYTADIFFGFVFVITDVLLQQGMKKLTWLDHKHTCISHIKYHLQVNTNIAKVQEI